MVRLNKYLALALGVSRREADDLIASGRVSVDGAVAGLGARVIDGAEVGVDGREVGVREKVYLALNKPVGYVSSRRAQDENPTLYELLPSKYRDLKTVGRLDKDSSGLILLTNDGDFAFLMTHPKFEKTKEYLVVLDHALAPLHQQMIVDFGVELGDGRSQFMLERLEGGAETSNAAIGSDASTGSSNAGDRRRWRVIMHGGRNRQIRRTFGALGYTVVELHRVRFGKFRLGGLAASEWVEISP